MSCPARQKNCSTFYNCNNALIDIFSCNCLCNRAKKTREIGRRKRQGWNKMDVLIVSYISKFRIKENSGENMPDLLKIRVSLVQFLVSAP